MKTTGTKHSVKRPQPHKALKVLQQVAVQHEFISEYVTIAMQSQALFDSPHPIKKVKGMKSFLADRVVKHFTFEEASVFPQLQAPVTRRTVDRLIREHQTMLSQVGTLQKMLSKMTASSTANAWNKLEASFGDLLRMLLAHTMREDILYEKQRASLPPNA